MSPLKPLVLAGSLALAAFAVSAVSANTYTPRQYYSSWFKHPDKGYYYSYYYYKPTPTYAGYKNHYAIYYPSRPGHYYFYNPYAKVFWGRAPIKCGGVPQYSLLPEKERKGRIEDIPEKAFPKPGPTPAVPDTNPEVERNPPTLDLPPDNPVPGKVGKEDLP